MHIPGITIAFTNLQSKSKKLNKCVIMTGSQLPVKPFNIGSVKECIGHHENDWGPGHVVGWSGREVRYIASVAPMSVTMTLKRPVRPTLTVIASQEDEEEFSALRKYGTGVTVDSELIKQASTTAFTDDKDEDERRYLRTKTARKERYCCKRNGVKRSKSGRGEVSEEVGGGKYFLWEDWKIDGIFLDNFSDYLQRIVSKWNTSTKLKEESKMLEALLKEKEENVNSVSTSKSIDFFLEVFMDFLNIKSKFPNRSMEQLVVELINNRHALSVCEFSANISSLALKGKEDFQRKAQRNGTQSYGWFERFEKSKSLSEQEKQADPPPTIKSNSTEKLTSRSIVSGNKGIVRQKRGTKASKNDILEKLAKNVQIKQAKIVNRNKEDLDLVRQCGDVADKVITEELMEITHNVKENTNEEYVPTEEEIIEEMQVRLFRGFKMPNTISDTECLEGRNKIECHMCEDHVMVALDCLLERVRGNESGKQSPLVFKKCSCMKKRKGKMKNSDMEYKPSYYRKNSLPGNQKTRKSSRVKGNQSGLGDKICQLDHQDSNDETFTPDQNQTGNETSCPSSRDDSKEDGFVFKPPRAEVNENYLKNRSEFASSEQIDTKDKNSQKITEFILQQKKNADGHSNRKYSGFELKTVSGSQTEIVIEVTMAQLSKEESDIIEDLLNDLKSEVTEKPLDISVPPNNYGIGEAFCGDSIYEFEEFQTMGENTDFNPNFDELTDI